MPRSKLLAAASADYGDYADDNIEIECEIESQAEPDEEYYHLKYYPIRIGQVLHNRYRIEHKLGWGGFSTVWLAQDMQRNVAVALKVLVSGEGQKELEINNMIAARIPDSPGLLLSQSSFFVRRGHRGKRRHLVLVLPVRGPSLESTYSQSTTPPTLRMSAAKHVLLALRNLHNAGFIHRDLTLSNVMWHIHPIDNWSTAERYRSFGRPQKLIISNTGDGIPGDLVAPIGRAFPKELIQGAACIGDFGLTLCAGADGANLDDHNLAQPLKYCAPERLHGRGPSFAADVWSFMVIFANLYTGINVVYGSGVSVLDRLVGLLGPFSKSWRECFDGGDPDLRRDWWYAGGGDIPHLVLSHLETLEVKIDRVRPEISAKERAHVVSFIRRGMMYSPEHRPTAAQLLEDPSFKALMGYYGC